MMTAHVQGNHVVEQPSVFADFVWVKAYAEDLRP